MAPFLSFLVVCSFACVIVASIQHPPYAIAMSVPAGCLLLVWLALRASAALEPVDDAFPQPTPKTPWRLVDPEFSHWGVWRADLGRLPAEVAEFRNGRRVKAYIHELLRDWSFRSARGGEVVRISRGVSRALNSLGDCPAGRNAYTITLDDGDLRRTGLLRFGPACVEFQLERNAAEPTAHLELFGDPQLPQKGEPTRVDVIREILESDVAESERAAGPTALQDPFLSHHHPMWDRWIDV
jgi:hypothetical protein